MSRVIVITPWKGGQDTLMPAYSHLVSMADLVVAVDNSGGEWKWATEAGFAWGRGDPEQSFSNSNNYGVETARVVLCDEHGAWNDPLCDDDIIVFLNSDTGGDPGWVQTAKDTVRPGYLYGTSLVSTRQVVAPLSGSSASISTGDVVFLEGWCLAATAGTWERIGWWPEWDGLYWEDVMVSLNAQRAGVPLRHVAWPIEHRVGQTTKTRPGITREFWVSRARFMEAL